MEGQKRKLRWDDCISEIEPYLEGCCHVLEGTQLTLALKCQIALVLKVDYTQHGPYKNTETAYSACSCTPECAKVVVEHNDDRLYIAHRTIPHS